MLTATFVKVPVDRSLQEAATVVFDHLGLAVFKFGCATLPTVCAPTNGICYVAVVNYSDKSIQFFFDTSIAANCVFKQTSNGIIIVALGPRLLYQAKLRKVLY